MSLPLSFWAYQTVKLKVFYSEVGKWRIFIKKHLNFWKPRNCSIKIFWIFTALLTFLKVFGIFRTILNIWKTELRPKIGIVCGSGLSGLADTIVDKVSIRNGYNNYILIRVTWRGQWLRFFTFLIPFDPGLSRLGVLVVGRMTDQFQCPNRWFERPSSYFNLDKLQRHSPFPCFNSWRTQRLFSFWQTQW